MLTSSAEDFDLNPCCRFTNLFARLNFVILTCPSYSSTVPFYAMHVTLWIVCIIIIYVCTLLLWPIIVFIISLIICYCWNIPNIERNMMTGDVEAHYFDFELREKPLTVKILGANETLSFRDSSSCFGFCFLNSFYPRDATGACVNV